MVGAGMLAISYGMAQMGYMLAIMYYKQTKTNIKIKVFNFLIIFYFCH